jgi:hypothetical protein
MYAKLSTDELKTGEPLEVGMVLCPDDDWVQRIIPFLWHKGEAWNAHLLTETLDFPAGKVQSYLDAEGDSRGALLEDLGFEREATLRSQLRVSGTRRDVAAYARLVT